MAKEAVAAKQVDVQKKWVYRFEDGNASMRDLLGGKGANCAEMIRAGLPVPPGFVVTTEACNAFYESSEAVSNRHVGADVGGAQRAGREVRQTVRGR